LNAVDFVEQQAARELAAFGEVDHELVARSEFLSRVDDQQ